MDQSIAIPVVQALECARASPQVRRDQLLVGQLFERCLFEESIEQFGIGFDHVIVSSLSALVRWVSVDNKMLEGRTSFKSASAAYPPDGDSRSRPPTDYARRVASPTSVSPSENPW